MVGLNDLRGHLQSLQFCDSEICVSAFIVETDFNSISDFFS